MLRFSETITGANDVTQGRRPEGVQAAAAIQELQEAAQTRIRLKERNLNNSLNQLGSMVIKLMMQFYRGTRVARLTGGKGEWPEFFEYYIEDTPEGATMAVQDFEFDEENEQFLKNPNVKQTQPTRGMFDVKVNAGTAMPHQRAQRANIGFRLYEGGAIDREDLLDKLEWPEADQVLQRVQEQEQAAKAEAQEQELAKNG